MCMSYFLNIPFLGKLLREISPRLAADISQRCSLQYYLQHYICRIKPDDNLIVHQSG